MEVRIQDLSVHTTRWETETLSTQHSALWYHWYRILYLLSCGIILPVSWWKVLGVLSAGCRVSITPNHVLAPQQKRVPNWRECSYITRNFVYQTERVFLCTHSCTKMGSEKHSVPWCLVHKCRSLSQCQRAPEQEGKKGNHCSHNPQRRIRDSQHSRHSALWYQTAFVQL